VPLAAEERKSKVRESGSEWAMTGYKKRAADRLIGELLTELGALLVVGPRATGKTTTALTCDHDHPA